MFKWARETYSEDIVVSPVRQFDESRALLEQREKKL